MPAIPWPSLSFAFVALVLAFFFHRQRLAQIALLLLLLAGARGDGQAGRSGAAALAFLPWLCLIVALLPESRWLARSQLLLMLVMVALIALVMRAPAHILIDVSRLFRNALPGHDPLAGAAWIVVLAMLLCLVRFLVRAAISEIVAAIALLLLAASCLRWWHGAQSDLLIAIAAISVILGVLYGSYRMAFIDALTGLPNRRSLDESMNRLGSRYVLAMVDVDHFKMFNDTHGHAAGDIVLREVGAILRRHSGGRAFRYGGEEFCVVFEDVDSSIATAGCERARAALEQARMRVRPAVAGSKKLSKPQDVSVTASFGVAARSATQKRAHEVLATADKALYKAKGRGRNRVESSA
jgi:diguanylate cyclase (GGDEF)-like protein